MLAWEHGEEQLWEIQSFASELQPLINEWDISLEDISTAGSIIQQSVTRRSNQGTKTITPRT